VALVGTRLYVALDARTAAAALVAGGLLAGGRLRGFARVPLPDGAIAPSPSGASLQQPDAVRDAIRQAVESAGGRGGRATLVLPAGLARLALLSLPDGAQARDFVRFRLAPTLPWPAGESIVDTLPLAHGRVIAAALRRGTVAEHEQALVAAGFEVERVHLAPMLAAQGLARSGPRDVVHVVLDDATSCLLALRGGSIVALRCRRRDDSPGEASRLLAEAARTARFSENGRAAELPVVFAGTDARRLRRELDAGEPGSLAQEDGRWPGAAEAAWLGGVLR